MAESEGRRRGAGRDVLTRRELEILQADWTRVERATPDPATVFYDRLFSLDPSLRRLFGKHLLAQRQKLMNLMGSAVHGLAQPEVLLPIVRHLGRKHQSYGVRKRDYLTFGTALFWTLREILGDGFGAQNALAWLNAYAVLSEAMQAV